ncbi:hypothetical protein POVWA1_039400 [Plasmodium ovale wallikeri]|uniref:Uncharacterized protein n=1 Tax=Plasmodium ovale wallikeri TaxID=864142 RepID=A0A1A8Z5M0_PLAOA|nr:hypothetical protein POVWA1_039400 [Plasmodium ovale wallikeri]
MVPRRKFLFHAQSGILPLNTSLYVVPPYMWYLHICGEFITKNTRLLLSSKTRDDVCTRVYNDAATKCQNSQIYTKVKCNSRAYNSRNLGNFSSKEKITWSVFTISTFPSTLKI